MTAIAKAKQKCDYGVVLAGHLRKARKAKKITMKDMAYELGVSDRTYAYYEKNCPIDVLFAAQELLGCRLEVYYMPVK